MTRPTPPAAVTDAHRRAAFERMRWPGLTYDEAMSFDMLRRIIDAGAQRLADDEQTSVEPVKPLTLGVDGHPLKPTHPHPHPATSTTRNT